MTEPELNDRLAFAMGGRTAEEIVFEEISTGAADDLQKATEIARAMVSEYGMSPKIGPLSFGQNGFRRSGGVGFLFPGDRPEFSEQTSQLIDQETARLLNEAHERAASILVAERELLMKLSKVLMEREVIDGTALKRWVDDETLIPTDEELEKEAEEKRQAANGQDAHAPAATSTILDRETTVQLPQHPVPVPGPSEVPPRPD
jgi:cell division protease FtsH